MAPKKTSKKPKATGTRGASKAAKKTAARKSTARKSTAKKTAAKKTAAKKPTARKAAAKKSASKKPTAKKAAAKKTAPKRSAAKKPAAKKAAPKKTAAKQAPKKAASKRATPKKTSPKKTSPKKSAAAVEEKPVTAPPVANVRPFKAPSTPKPTSTRPARRVKLDKAALKKIKDQLEQDRRDLETRLGELEQDSFMGSQSDMSGEVGLNEDPADAGTATFDRERDLSIRNNVLDLIDQITRALNRIDEGLYGTCENCGRPIDAARLKAFPRVLLCLDCKRREERTR